MAKTKIAYIRLDKEAEEAIEKKIADTNLNQSEAIRMIIREWAEMKSQRMVIPKGARLTENGTIEFDPFWDTEEGTKEAAERG